MGRDNQTEGKSYWKRCVWAVVILAVLIVNYNFLSDHMSSNNSFIRDFQLQEDVVEKYKEPAVSGIFYSANPDELNRDLGKYLKASYKHNVRKPKILIVPHAGYKYSAQVAAAAYGELLKYKDVFSNVVIIGPAHYAPIKGMALPNYSSFKTPLGNVAVNQEQVASLLNNSLFAYNNKAFSKEHSIEVQLPFLQKILQKFQIIPILYGDITAQELADALRVFINDENTLLVFSADLSHYYKAERAEEIDAHTARMIDLGNAGLDKEMSCGAEGINAALLLAKDMQMSAKLLDITHSGKISGNMDKVVGYGAWSFGEDEKEQNKTEIEQEVLNLKNFASIYGQDLLNIAEQSLKAAVTGEGYEVSRKDYPDVLFDKGASFVTLTKNGKLRGCIGSLMPRNAIADDVAKNIRKAALEDKRFEPVVGEKLKDLEIAISFLTNYEKIEFTTEEDLLNQIVQGTDGVVLRDGNRQGVFLPSVWSEFKDKKEFLENLKLKAGLAPNYWSEKIKIYRFRTVEIKRDEN